MPRPTCLAIIYPMGYLLLDVRKACVYWSSFTASAQTLFWHKKTYRKGMHSYFYIIAYAFVGVSPSDAKCMGGENLHESCKVI